MNLEHCKQLRSICYWIFMFSNNPRNNRLYWDAIIALLTEGADKLLHLERIKFAISLSGETKLLAHQLGDLDWKQLESILSRMPSLQTVEISVDHRGRNVGGNEADNMAWNTITERLPTMASRGILRRGTK